MLFRPCQLHKTVYPCLQISALASIWHPEPPVDSSDQEHVEDKDFNGEIEDVETWLVLDRVRIRSKTLRQEVGCIPEGGTSTQQ